MFQSEFPYDVDGSYGDDGYAAFTVSDKGQGFQGWGIGAYSYFRDHEVWANSAIKV